MQRVRTYEHMLAKTLKGFGLLRTTSRKAEGFTLLRSTWARQRRVQTSAHSPDHSAKGSDFPRQIEAPGLLLEGHIRMFLGSGAVLEALGQNTTD